MVNIHQIKAKLSEYLDAAIQGERVVICKHNQPVAELRSVERVRSAPRDLTPMHPGEIFVTSAFFDPLPADEIVAWEGTEAQGLRVAEPRGNDTTRTGRKAKRKGRA